MAQPGRAPGSGPGGRWFKSSLPDHYFLRTENPNCLENRLTSVTLPGSGGTVTFKYDPFGRRIQKSGPAGTSNYLYDGANAVTDVNASGAVVASYTQGAGIDEPLASVTGTGTVFFEADGLGSITSLSSATGVTDTYTYKPFGITTATGSNPNRFRFTGREWDQETGLYYYRARYYDPNIGRFLSEDPIGLQGGMNVYGYVAGRPLNWVDPSGTEMSPAECYRRWKSIMDRVELLKNKLSKYNPIADALGNQPYSAGGKTGITKVGTHYATIIKLQVSLTKDIYDYWNNCKGGPKIPKCVWEPINKKIEAPKTLPTTEELRLLEQAAIYDQKFWETIVYGDVLLGSVSGAMFLAPGLGAGGTVSAPLAAAP